MSNSTRRRIVPVSLGAAMLAVVIAAALVPNAGAVPASSNCPYGNCSSSPATIPVWELASIGAIIVLGLLIGLFLLMRRRRPPAEEAPAAYAAGGAPPAGAVEQGPSSAPEDMSAAAYVETADDVGTAPPSIAAPAAAAGAGAGAAAESEPDIDSLMAELDKISGEILKRTPKKGTPGTPEEDLDGAPPG
jgi:hypothetical protein